MNAAESLGRNQPVGVSLPALRSRTALVHRNLDSWLIGGLSLLAFGLMYIAVDKTAPITQVSWAAFYLAFIINGPHFFASYWHIYVDGRDKIMTNPKYFWAAVVVPALLIGGLFIASRRPDQSTIGFMVNLMFLSVGWHYVKQIFGVSLVASAAHGRPVLGLAKLAFRINLLSVWALSFIATNEGARRYGWYGVNYESFNLPTWTRPVAYVVLGVTGAFALAMFARDWIRTGTTMALVGWVAWASIYVWYLPVLAHPGYGYLIPFFHSLQYLMFSATLSWNKSRALASSTTPIGQSQTSASGPPDADPKGADDLVSGSSGDPAVAASASASPTGTGLFSLATQQARQRFLVRFGAFVGVTFVLGAAGFHWIPEWLDRNHTYRPGTLGPTFYIVAFNLFINIHHYFVDNVIWRGTNTDVRTYLRPRPA